MKKIELQQALSDIEIIKQIVNNDQQQGRLVGITLKSNIILLTASAFLAIVLCVFEAFASTSMTSTMLSAVHGEELKAFGIGFMAFILVSLLVLLYFILWRASKHNNENYNDYVARNFAYFKSTSLISDLVIKFAAISLLVLANKPEWIALLLTAFIGDYLLQSRLFIFPRTVSMILGIACFGISIAMFYMTISNLLIPLAIFTLVSLASLIRLLQQHRHLETSAENV